MTTMGCDIVAAAYEDEEFDGSDFSSSSSCSPAPSWPPLSEMMLRVADTRARARAALFIGGDWTDELSFSHYYHQHWANQVCAELAVSRCIGDCGLRHSCWGGMCSQRIARC